MNSAISKSLVNWFHLKLSIYPESPTSYEELRYLTVVIPSYCRQPFLLRQIVYWMNTPATLIILDGSPEPLPLDLLNLSDKKLKLTYVHNPVHPIDRLDDLPRLIKTKYVVMCGDDEFHLQCGLRKAIQRLEEKLDEIGCMGQSLRYFISKDKSNIVYGMGYPHFKYEVQSVNPRVRFKQAMEQYNAATPYAVMRKEVWLEAAVSSTKTACKEVWEVQQALTTYSAGKFSTVDVVYWLRSDENPPIADTDIYKNVSFPEWLQSRVYASERKKVIGSIAAVLKKYGDISMAKAESLAHDGLRMFCHFHQNAYPEVVISLADKIKSLLRIFLKSVLSAGVYKKIKFFYKPQLDSIEIRPDIIGPRGDLDSHLCGSLFLYNAETDNALIAIESLVLDFYKNTDFK